MAGPQAHRFRFDPAFAGTCVTMPPPGHWIFGAILIAWCLPWIPVSVLLRTDWSLQAPGQAAALALGVVVPLAFDLFGLALGLFLISGREELRVRRGEGTVELFRGLGSLGWTRRLPLHQVRSLRLLNERPVAPEAAKVPFLGALLLEAGEQRMRFGFGLNAEEGRALLTELRLRHTAFGPVGEPLR